MKRNGPEAVFILRAAGAVILLAVSQGCETPGLEPMPDIVQDTLHVLVPYNSIGVDLGDSTLMLGNVWAVGTTPDGRIYVLDASVTSIRFYTPQGEYLESFSPVGQGPGEFTSIDRLAVDPEGNWYMGSFSNMKMALYDSELNFVREIRFDGGLRSGPGKIACGPDSGFITTSMIMVPEEDLFVNQCALFTDSNEPVLVYRERTAPMSDQLNARPMTDMRITSSPDGRVYISDCDPENYRIICYSAQGDSLFTFGLPDYQPVPKPETMVEAVREQALQQYVSFHGTEEGFNFEPSPYWLPVASMQVDGENRIWVRGEQYSELADIFSGDGEYLYSVKLNVPGGQECRGWSIKVGPGGMFCNPIDPELFPVVYMLREELFIYNIS